MRSLSCFLFPPLTHGTVPEQSRDGVCFYHTQFDLNFSYLDFSNPVFSKVGFGKLDSSVSERVHTFPKLPIELRTMIWLLALPRKRRVDVSRDRQHIPSPELYLTIIPPIILILGANSEAREIALQHHLPQFNKILYGKTVNIDYATDVFHFAGVYEAMAGLLYCQGKMPNPVDARSESLHFRKNVRHLALDNTGSLNWMVYQCIGRIENLETLVIRKTTCYTEGPVDDEVIARFQIVLNGNKLMPVIAFS